MSEEVKISGNQLQIENTVYQLDYKVLDYITNLQNQLQQIEEYQKALDEITSEKIDLENIIKEVREWANKCSCQFINDDGELVVSEISFNIQARPCDLFKILDKGDD